MGGETDLGGITPFYKEDATVQRIWSLTFLRTNAVCWLASTLAGKLNRSFSH